MSDSGPTPKEAKIQARIEDVLSETPNAFFLQIGSNDGVRGDPIHRIIMRNEQWRGLFVEPIKFLFEKLTKNYSGTDRFYFENVAIGNERGKLPIFYLHESAHDSQEGFPAWCDQIGSFKRSHITNCLGEKAEPYIRQEDVDCVLIEDILVKNKIDVVDFLHIDTEGFDYKVLSQFDFKHYNPLIVMYENKHIPKEEKKLAEVLLENHGYELEIHGGDTIGVKQP